MLERLGRLEGADQPSADVVGAPPGRKPADAAEVVLILGRVEDDLEALAAGVRKNLNILNGWRFEQFGKDALDLVEGRLAFAIENGKLKMSRVVNEEEPVDA